MEFILITEKESKQKICIAVDYIISVVECIDGTAFLETSFVENGISTGIYTTELFTTIANSLKVLKIGGNQNV